MDIPFNTSESRESPEPITLLSKLLPSCPKSRVVLRTALGALAVALIEEGGSLNITASGGDRGVEIETSSRQIRITPSSSADPEQQAIFWSELEAIEKQGDKADPIDVAVATLRAMLLTNSEMEARG